mmetsp:Transcript_2214/g.2467  ORF Transcript_2214/g.2467 Transcript_2214/m.2467 type:complete len:88 (+) Transcript_2214:23-286(+)
MRTLLGFICFALFACALGNSCHYHYSCGTCLSDYDCTWCPSDNSCTPKYSYSCSGNTVNKCGCEAITDCDGCVKSTGLCQWCGGYNL